MIERGSLMKETIGVIIDTLRGYRGESLYLTWYLLAVFYLFFAEKDKHKRLLLLYVPLTVLLLFVFPPAAHVVIHTVMDNEIFYRQLWLLPCAATVCYAVCHAVMNAKYGVWKVLVCAAGILVIMAGGSNVFQNGNYTPAQNPQHLPQAAINVCDEILNDDVEYMVVAAFPLSLIEYTRQYTAEIVSPYGRPVIIDKWHAHHALYDAIEAPVLNAEELVTLARADRTECIVVHSIKQMEGNMEDYSFYHVATVDGYDIYMEKWLAERHNGFSLPEDQETE